MDRHRPGKQNAQLTDYGTFTSDWPNTHVVAIGQSTYVWSDGQYKVVTICSDGQEVRTTLVCGGSETAASLPVRAKTVAKRGVRGR